MTAIKIVEKNDCFDVLVNDTWLITYSNNHPMESFIDLLDNLKRDLGYEISVDRMDKNES